MARLNSSCSHCGHSCGILPSSGGQNGTFDPCKDERGAVYVEFLIAFFPLFLLFLAICQLALVTAARVVVSHAAVAGVRSAIVVLEDPGDEHDNYDGAAFGILSHGGSQSAGPSIPFGSTASSILTPAASSESNNKQQSGPRMTPIRQAAQAPLAVLAPSFGSLQSAENTLSRAVSVGNSSNESFAFTYTQAASAITVHSSESSDELATEPLPPTDNVTVRVAYLYRCAVPWVRSLMCRTLTNLLNPDPSSSNAPVIERLKQAGASAKLQQWVSSSERFAILIGQASLPNQGTDVPEEADK